MAATSGRLPVAPTTILTVPQGAEPWAEAAAVARPAVNGTSPS